MLYCDQSDFSTFSREALEVSRILLYTYYGEIGTAIVGQYQKSGPASGTIDINIPGQVGHKTPYP